MEVGSTFIDYWGWRVPLKWADGAPKKSIWTGLSLWGKKHTDVASRRCRDCGYLELFAGSGVEADYGGMQLRAENERLKKELSGVLDRIATLERIATDPAERTAREIEKLRKLPGSEDDSG